MRRDLDRRANGPAKQNRQSYEALLRDEARRSAFFPDVDYRTKIASGLVYCAWGDFLLCMEDDPTYGGDAWFLTGLFAFLIGHVYLTLALRNRLLDQYRNGIINTNVWAKPLIILCSLFMMKILIPEMGDRALQAGGVLYAIVIGTMAYHSLMLATAESNLKDQLFEKLQVLPDKSTLEYVFTRRMYESDRGYVAGLRMHAVASITFLISDSILGYSKFVEKDERQLAVMVTYYTSLVFFALAAMADSICARCVLGRFGEEVEVDDKKKK